MSAIWGSSFGKWKNHRTGWMVLRVGSAFAGSRFGDPGPLGVAGRRSTAGLMSQKALFLLATPMAINAPRPKRHTHCDHVAGRPAVGEAVEVAVESKPCLCRRSVD